MGTTLIINPGSSSKKYAFYKDGKQVLTVVYEKTTEGFAACVRKNTEQQKCENVPDIKYTETTKSVIASAKELSIISDEAEIDRVGIRVVAPGEYFFKHRIIDEDFIKQLRDAQTKAPLHIPAVLEEIGIFRDLLPHALPVAVSDSAFHNTVSSWKRQYSLKGAEDLGVRKYGYHGLSIASVSRHYAQVGVRDDAKAVVVHVGNGVSVVGLDKGESQYTSMGYTPVSGMMMGSRAGDIDPGGLIAVLEEKGLSGSSAQEFIQTEGGFNGMIGVKDLRSVLHLVANKDIEAIAAFNKFSLEVAEQIVKAAVAIGGLDAILLTGTAVERNPDLRLKILDHLKWLGVSIDIDINDSTHSTNRVISATDSKLLVALVPTNEMEEMEIVCQTFPVSSIEN